MVPKVGCELAPYPAISNLIMASHSRNSDTFDDDGKDEGKDVNFSYARIKSIMKKHPDLVQISVESLHLITKSAELFIQNAAKGAHEESGFGKMIDYDHFAAYIQKQEPMDFLHSMVPHKITFREYKDFMKKERGVVISSEDSSSSSSTSNYSNSSESEGEEK